MLHKAVKYSVPWEMCYPTAYKRVIGAKLHVYGEKRRHVCTHDVCDVKGAFMRLEEHRRQPESDWLDTAERMRVKWNCVKFQHFINGFKKENPDRHLGKQLAAVERYLDEKRPTRELVAAVMEACCRDYRYRYGRSGCSPSARAKNSSSIIFFGDLSASALSSRSIWGRNCLASVVRISSVSTSSC